MIVMNKSEIYKEPLLTHKKEFMSSEGESKFRYRLLFPLHWQTGTNQALCPMFDKSDIDAN